MANFLILLTALGFSAYTVRSMLLWITAGDDEPGEWENPLSDLDESEVKFKKDDMNLVVSIQLSEAEEKCILITSKHYNQAMHISVQQADPPEGLRRVVYSLTGKDGKYSHKLKLKPSTKRILYGPEKIEVMRV